MSRLFWPLRRNMIRRDVTNNAFGMVRNGGTKAHQGWDLMATPLTECFAIADGKIQRVYFEPDGYGNTAVLKFEYLGRSLYAFYAHLSFVFVKKDQVVARGSVLGLTGNTGNASNMQGEDQHLHFEIRTSMQGGQGLVNRLINPAIKKSIYSSLGGIGNMPILKIPGNSSGR